MPSLTTGPMVVLPQPQIKWLMSQPSNILDADGPQRELLSSDHTMDVPILESRDHIHALVRDLTRNLGSLTADIAEELDDAFKRTWGEDTEKWTEISPYETIMEIVAQTANRVFVGLPLCETCCTKRHTWGAKICHRPGSNLQCPLRTHGTKRSWYWGLPPSRTRSPETVRF